MNHRQPLFITFTGIDDRTDLTRADKLASVYPIEWGVLMSSNNRDACFPCNQAVDEILQIKGQKSAHLCGSLASRASQGSLPERLHSGQFNRVQVNGYRRLSGDLLEATEKARLELILQNRSDRFTANPAAAELFDCSGGKGLLPDTIPAPPHCGSLVGYAGGIGPETVVSYLSKIEGTSPFWIDMEGRIRTNGWFDLDLVEAVCQRVFD